MARCNSTASLSCATYGFTRSWKAATSHAPEASAATRWEIEVGIGLMHRVLDLFVVLKGGDFLQQESTFRPDR
jgi:hypothetical protein